MGSSSLASQKLSTISVLAVGVGCASYFTWHFWGKKKSRARQAISAKRNLRRSSGRKPSPRNQDGEPEIVLPTHLERDLRKEERRQRLIPMLSMKRPMYDNIIMKDPAGHALNTISLKKARWYVSKKLAVWKGDKCIHLNFFPKQRSNHDGNQVLYNQSTKKNACVVCEHDQNYMRHYIVPYCYRSLLPDHFKTHLPHDLVILCPDCHVRAETVTNKRMRSLEAALRRSQNLAPSTARPTFVDRRMQEVKIAGQTLLKYKHQLPAKRIIEYESVLRDYFLKAENISLPDCIDPAYLEKASLLETTVANPDFRAGPDLVIASLGGQDRLIENFVRTWRRLFLDSMQPAALPRGWAIDAPVRSDPRGKNGESSNFA